MAMLAEPRRKKRSINLRATNDWSEDQNKFGKKLMQKMGWTPGKGLGVNEDGSTDHIKVRFKDDNEGVGFKDFGDQWTEHDSNFEILLRNLHNGNIDNTKLHSEKSLEDKSKSTKSRLHYKKFTRGKDITKYSHKDLANIFGKKSTHQFNVNSSDVSQTDSDCIMTDTATRSAGSDCEPAFKNSLKKNVSKIKEYITDYDTVHFQGFSQPIKDDDHETKTNKPNALKMYSNFQKASENLEGTINDCPDNSTTTLNRKSKKKKKVDCIENTVDSINVVEVSELRKDEISYDDTGLLQEFSTQSEIKKVKRSIKIKSDHQNATCSPANKYLNFCKSSDTIKSTFDQEFSISVKDSNVSCEEVSNTNVENSNGTLDDSIADFGSVEQKRSKHKKKCKISVSAEQEDNCGELFCKPFKSSKKKSKRGTRELDSNNLDSECYSFETEIDLTVDSQKPNDLELKSKKKQKTYESAGQEYESFDLHHKETERPKKKRKRQLEGLENVGDESDNVRQLLNDSSKASLIKLKEAFVEESDNFVESKDIEYRRDGEAKKKTKKKSNKSEENQSECVNDLEVIEKYEVSSDSDSPIEMNKRLHKIDRRGADSVAMETNSEAVEISGADVKLLNAFKFAQDVLKTPIDLKNLNQVRDRCKVLIRKLQTTLKYIDKCQTSNNTPNCVMKNCTATASMEVSIANKSKHKSNNKIPSPTTGGDDDMVVEIKKKKKLIKTKDDAIPSCSDTQNMEICVNDQNISVGGADVQNLESFSELFLPSTSSSMWEWQQLTKMLENPYLSTSRKEYINKRILELNEKIFKDMLMSSQNSKDEVLMLEKLSALCDSPHISLEQKQQAGCVLTALRKKVIGEVLKDVGDMDNDYDKTLRKLEALLQMKCISEDDRENLMHKVTELRAKVANGLIKMSHWRDTDSKDLLEKVRHIMNDPFLPDEIKSKFMHKIRYFKNKTITKLTAAEPVVDTDNEGDILNQLNFLIQDPSLSGFRRQKIVNKLRVYKELGAQLLKESKMNLKLQLTASVNDVLAFDGANLNIIPGYGHVS